MSEDTTTTQPRRIGRVTAAATTGGAAGYAAATVIVWVLSVAGLQVPDAVADALGLLITAAASLIGGWLIRPTSKGDHAA